MAAGGISTRGLNGLPSYTNLAAGIGANGATDAGRGQDGGALRIFATDFEGSLVIDTSGGTGGDAQAGGQGAAGGPGAIATRVAQGGTGGNRPTGWFGWHARSGLQRGLRADFHRVASSRKHERDGEPWGKSWKSCDTWGARGPGPGDPPNSGTVVHPRALGAHRPRARGGRRHRLRLRADLGADRAARWRSWPHRLLRHRHHLTDGRFAFRSVLHFRTHYEERT